MTLNLSSKTMIAVLAACSLTLHGCASTHYSMQTTATKGIQENYLPDSRFNINLIKRPYGNIEDSDKALYRAVVSGFTGNGLQLTDKNVNSYVTNNENIYQIEIDFMHRRDLGGASIGVLWALSFMTLFIFPLALSEEIETKVKLFNTSGKVGNHEFSIPYKKTFCFGLTPLSFLCAPNKKTFGRSLGAQIAKKIVDSSLP